MSKMPHFSLLPEDELKRICEHTTDCCLEKGTIYTEKGRTHVDSILIVRKGELALYDEGVGSKTLSGHIKAGEVFGGITILMNGGISLRTAIAEQDCHGYRIPESIFQDLCTRYKSFYDYFLENFSKHILDERLTAIIETGQVRQFIKGVDPFSFLPEEELDRVISDLTMVQYPKNTILFIQGKTRMGYVYILQKGSAEIFYEENFKETMHELLYEGDIYGGISMLMNDGVSVRTVRVNEPAWFYLVPKKRFLDICENYQSFTEYFTDIFGKRMLKKSYAAIISKTLQTENNEHQFFNQHVARIYRPNPIFGDQSISIQQAADIMRRHKISSLFLKCESGVCSGVVTERDLTRRVIATGYDINRPVSDIMSSPVDDIPEYSLIIEALIMMMRKDIRHLAVTDVDGNVVGILSNNDLLTAQGQSPLFMIREISEAENMQEIISIHGRLPALVKSLITGGARAENVTRFITTVSDAILKKIMAFTVEEMGPAPAKFVFMILGSEGRREQTLKTDQDNAIVYEDVAPAMQEQVAEYFLAFGDTACTLLDLAGYDFCTGDVMAKNPKWCQPLSAWKNYFSNWIHAAEPQNLLQASIFFDFRYGYGDVDIINSLRRHLFESLSGWSGFFRHLTENALHFRPPLGFFRNFVVESEGKHRNEFDIKSAMTPIVDFARIYALKNKIEQTNTLDRINELRLKKVLSRQEYEEIEKAYSFLMQLRFVRQVTAVIDEKSKPNNYINPKKLTRIEQKMLKEIFKRIEKFQTKIEFEFIGIV